MNDPNDKTTTERAIAKVGEVGDRAANKVEEARHRAEAGVQQNKERLANQIQSIAQAVQEGTRHLRDSDQSQVADYADKLGQQVERVSKYVRANDVQDLIRDVESIARRKPALFFGGAFAIGLIGGRFMRSSGRATSSSSTSVRKNDETSMSRSSTSTY